ncbi:MAG: ATP-binding protein [Bacilli bacterium]|nr:ATP-binding protein [Bacilli bacterium]
MFGKILFINDNIAHVENKASLDSQNQNDLMNMHVVFESNDQRILGEVTEFNQELIKIRFLGEFINGKYVNGVLRKPLLTSSIRIINDEELKDLVGSNDETTFPLGKNAVYKDFTVYPKVNDLFSNHLAIFGNSGSGKSCGVARIVQNLFSERGLLSYNANLFIFDAYGEYKNAFSNLSQLNPNYNYKFITTNKTDADDFDLKIPFHLLNLDDVALLLQASTHSQLPIIERTIKLCRIFALDNEESTKYKNHLIAKALLAVLFSNQTISRKKNEVFKIIEVCHTPDFNFDSTITGLGYTRTFSECFEIDSKGNFGESVLITDYILKHISDEIEAIEPPKDTIYTIDDFAKALEFTLISEGFQNNSNLYSDAIIMKVRINAIVTSSLKKIFDSPAYKSVGEYITSLVAKNNRKSQIININLEDIDDTHAKVIVKIISRLLFEFAKTSQNRGKIPFHLFLEEAHRYIQRDSDTFLIGYNIFDRIAKEGRKYGVILDIISQRPVEISDTVIAQCSNFFIFKMTHPKDIKYIEEMLPNISSDVIEKQKILQPGNCVAFGSAFKIPMIIKMEMPNPSPHSSSCDITNVWKVNQNR